MGSKAILGKVLHDEDRSKKVTHSVSVIEMHILTINLKEGGVAAVWPTRLRMCQMGPWMMTYIFSGGGGTFLFCHINSHI